MFVTDDLMIWQMPLEMNMNPPPLHQPGSDWLILEFEWQTQCTSAKDGVHGCQAQVVCHVTLTRPHLKFMFTEMKYLESTKWNLNLEMWLQEFENLREFEWNDEDEFIQRSFRGHSTRIPSVTAGFLPKRRVCHFQSQNCNWGGEYSLHCWKHCWKHSSWASSSIRQEYEMYD